GHRVTRSSSSTSPSGSSPPSRTPRWWSSASRGPSSRSTNRPGWPRRSCAGRGDASVAVMDRQPMRARFPGVAARRGGYESFYAKAVAPDRSQAVWIRYTVHQRPHEPPRGSMWFTWFDAAAGAPLASKVTVAAPPLAEDDRLHIGEGVFGAGVVSGAAPSEAL